MSKDPTSDESSAFDLNRRTLLRSIGAGSASLVGLSGVSAGSPSSSDDSNSESQAMKQAEKEFADSDAIAEALVDHGKPVSEQLQAENISLSLHPDDFDELRTFPDYHDEIPTAHIVAEKIEESHRIELHLLPQADHSFAYEETESGFRRFSSEGDGPTLARFCHEDTYCTNSGCKAVGCAKGCCPKYLGSYRVTERCCILADRTLDCSIINRVCTGDCGSVCG